MNSSSIATTNFKHVHSRDIEAVHKQFEEDVKRPLPISLAYQFGKSVIPGATSSDVDIKNYPMIASSEELKGEILLR